jgi:hypothetical protein
VNTPEPCCKCKYLYYDCIMKDDPDCYTECTKGGIIGTTDCPLFEEWKERPYEE